ncbi:hypothetical protein Y032_0159g3305 [Ancylostoma ceylanicum]|uniref:Uncharacterized protein n=1 Tax=Ancylostoma ceylanicum TaxID=53326 RepID=A0A016SYW6_9BILA|nr:hypothetical protein Y032_0159g3305 [Ancylostoma ceylanicum]
MEASNTAYSDVVTICNKVRWNDYNGELARGQRSVDVITGHRISAASRRRVAAARDPPAVLAGSPGAGFSECGVGPVRSSVFCIVDVVDLKGRAYWRFRVENRIYTQLFCRRFDDSCASESTHFLRQLVG